MIATAVIDAELAKEKARVGDLDGAIELSRAALEEEFASGGRTYGGSATAVMVEALLRRGGDADPQEAQAAMSWLAAVPTEPGFVMHGIWLLRLRALLAREHGDEISSRTSGIGIARWRKGLTSKDTSRWPRQ